MKEIKDKNIFTINEEIQIGNIILEKGDKIKLVESAPKKTKRITNLPENYKKIKEELGDIVDDVVEVLQDQGVTPETVTPEVVSAVAYDNGLDLTHSESIVIANEMEDQSMGGDMVGNYAMNQGGMAMPGKGAGEDASDVEDEVEDEMKDKEKEGEGGVSPNLDMAGPGKTTWTKTVTNTSYPSYNGMPGEGGAGGKLSRWRTTTGK